MTRDEEDYAELLAHVPVSDSLKVELSAKMSAPNRFYHGIGHLAQLWRTHRSYAVEEGLTSPEIERLLACAIAFHDCVFDSSRRDNEAFSAKFWMRASVGSPLDAADRLWVAETILATRDHLGYDAAKRVENTAVARLRERARIWALDLDLTPLGRSPAEFDLDTALLRSEAAQMTDAEWEAGRLSFFRRTAQAPQIFRSPTLAAIFEAPARSNLARYLRGT